MIKILYLMHISWGWIKQRPQFIAEALSESCQIDVMYRMSNRSGNDLNPQIHCGNLNVIGVRSWPFERVKFIPIELTYRYNKYLWKKNNIDINSYDYIWVTSPMLWWTIKDNYNPNGDTKIIYDCMDDYSAFPYMDKYPKYKIFSEQRESELIKAADFVFCSADALRRKLYNRYGIKRKYDIVNNAITSNITAYRDDYDDIDLPNNSLVYIGTVSEWFDFENTLKALNDNPKLHVILYGPKRMSVLPSHDRLEFRGPISHDRILTVMKKATGLFMPFVVNELIESVNPVKLYEYVYSGKPILASRYGETLPFEKYVTLYSDYKEFNDFVRNSIISESQINESEMKSFALDNTWRARVNQIKKIIGIENGKV